MSKHQDYEFANGQAAPWQAGYYADWSRGKLEQKDAVKLAESQWGDGVVDYLVQRSDPKKGAQVEGKDVVRQWRVHLHSITGPLHWVAELEDGRVLLK